MKSIKIVWILFITITLSAILIATNSGIIVKQRTLILTATYIIGMIAGFLGTYAVFLEINDKEK